MSAEDNLRAAIARRREKKKAISTKASKRRFKSIGQMMLAQGAGAGGESIAELVPEVGRTLWEGARAGLVPPSRLPPVEPSGPEGLLNVAVGTLGGALLGRALGGAAGAYIAGAPTAGALAPAGALIGQGLGAWGAGLLGGWHAKETLRKAYREDPAAAVGTRGTYLDVFGGVVSTGGRLTAAGLSEGPRLRDETRLEAMRKAFALPHMTGQLRDWTETEMMLAKERGIDPHSLGVLGRGLAKDLLFDPSMMLRGPSLVATKGKAVADIGDIILRMARKAGRADAPKLAAEGSAMAAKILSKKSFYDAVPDIKRSLTDLLPDDIGIAAVRAFDDEGIAIGRGGLRATPLGVLALPGMAHGLTGGALKATGGVLGFAGRRGLIPGPTAMHRIPGLERTGKAISRFGAKHSEAAEMYAKGSQLGVDIIPARKLFRFTVKDIEGIENGRWAAVMSHMLDPLRKGFSPIQEMFPRGLNAPPPPGHDMTAFDSFASRNAYYEGQRARADEIAHDTEAIWNKVAALAGEYTSKARTGAARWAQKRLGRAPKDHIDDDLEGLLNTIVGASEEAVKKGRKQRLDDERGFQQAVTDSPHMASGLRHENNQLIHPLDRTNIESVMLRHSKALLRVKKLKQAALDAWETNNEWAQKAKETIGRWWSRYEEVSGELATVRSRTSDIKKTLHVQEQLSDELRSFGVDLEMVTTRKGDELLSVAPPSTKQQESLLDQLLHAGWDEVDAPKGMPQGRLYYRANEGMRLPDEVAKEYRKVLAAGEARAEVLESHLGVLVDPEGWGGLRTRELEAINLKEDEAMAAALTAIEDAADAEARIKLKRTPEELLTQVREIDRELVLAIRRAYAGAMQDTHASDGAEYAAQFWGDRLIKVQDHFGVDLSRTWLYGADPVKWDSALYSKIKDVQDDRLAGLGKFADSWYKGILDDLVQEFGENAPEELVAYTKHILKERDNRLRRIPSKTWSSVESAKGHRAHLSLREDKVAGLDPVSDILQSMAAAAVASINIRSANLFTRKILDDGRFAVRAKGATKGVFSGKTHDLITHPKTGEEFFVAKDIAEDMRRMLDGFDPQKRDEILAAFEKYLVMPWKAYATFARPAFHLRNAYSNVWLMWMGGYDITVRPERLSQSIKIGSLKGLESSDVQEVLRAARKPLKGKKESWAAQKSRHASEKWRAKLTEWADEVHTMPDGTTYTGMELYQMASRNGVVNKRWLAADVDLDMAKRTESIRASDPVNFAFKAIPLSRDSFYLKLGAGVGQGVENHARLTLFLDRMLHHGDSARAAANSVRKHLFDYKELTQHERTLWRRVMPFYTWARKATAHETMALIEHPHRYLAATKIKRSVEGLSGGLYDTDKEYKRSSDTASEWIKQRWGWRLWFTSPRSTAFFWDPNLPMQELNRFGAVAEVATGNAGALQQAVRGMLGQMAPIYKLPIAGAMNLKYPERRPIRRWSEPRWLTGEVAHAFGVEQIQGTDAETGLPVTLMDEWYSYALENYFPHVAVVSKLFDKPKGDAGKEEARPYRFGREATGIGIYPQSGRDVEKYYVDALSRSLEEHRGLKRIKKGTMRRRPSFPFGD